MHGPQFYTGNRTVMICGYTVQVSLDTGVEATATVKSGQGKPRYNESFQITNDFFPIRSSTPKAFVAARFTLRYKHPSY